MNMLAYILLMGNPEGGEGNPLMSFLPLILIVVVFYFFMIRPQAKKQKQLRQFRESLKAGDKVVTIGGIYGKVVELKDNAVVLEVANQVRLKVDKSAVNQDASSIGENQPK